MAVRSDIFEFYELSREEKIKYLKRHHVDLEYLNESVSIDELEQLSENVIGSYELPFSIATYFRVNGRDYLVPMVTEEKTVVAAASHGAKLVRSSGGFKAETYRIMKGQVLIECEDCHEFKEKLHKGKENLIRVMNEQSRHSRVKDIHAKMLPTLNGNKLVLEAFIDTKDAMGANTITRMMESVRWETEKLGGEYYLGIISNLPLGTTKVSAKIPLCELKHEKLNGEKIAKRIETASLFAEVNFERALTHNKGIMNGIDAVALAAGNDFRAVEAAAHGYACRKGEYHPLSKWYIENDFLIGDLELPIPLGTVSSSTTKNPKSKLALNILGVKSSEELSNVAGSVGLAQNLAALYSLVTDGISKSHKKV